MDIQVTEVRMAEMHNPNYHHILHRKGEFLLRWRVPIFHITMVSKLEAINRGHKMNECRYCFKIECQLSPVWAYLAPPTKYAHLITTLVQWELLNPQPALIMLHSHLKCSASFFSHLYSTHPILLFSDLLLPFAPIFQFSSLGPQRFTLHYVLEFNWIRAGLKLSRFPGTQSSTI